MDLTVALTGFEPERALPAMAAMAELLRPYEVQVEFLALCQWPAAAAPAAVEGHPF